MDLDRRRNYSVGRLGNSRRLIIFTRQIEVLVRSKKLLSNFRK
jgi:hypothetical protein